MGILKRNKSEETTQKAGILPKAAEAKAATGKAADANEYYDKGEIMIKADKDNVGFSSNYKIINYDFISGERLDGYEYRNTIDKRLNKEIMRKRYHRLYHLDYTTGEFFSGNDHRPGHFKCVVSILSNEPGWDRSFPDNDPRIFGLLPAHFFTPENRLALENLAKKNIEFRGIKYKLSYEEIKVQYEELRQIYEQKCAECNEFPEIRKQEAENRRIEAENKRLKEESAAVQKQKEKVDEKKRQGEIRGIIGKLDDEMQRTE